MEKAPAPKQADPTILTLFGTTDYDPATVTIVRIPFDNCRVDKVLVDLGSTVKKGDPLLELFSTDLAAAKSDYEVACSQWAHDKKVYDYKAPLAKANTLSKKELIEVENNEQQSRLKMRLAKDKLLVYGADRGRDQEHPERGRHPESQDDLTVAGQGVVVKRSVVRGNSLRLQGRAHDDHPAGPFWVRANVNDTMPRSSRSARPEGHLPLLRRRPRGRCQARLHR